MRRRHVQVAVALAASALAVAIQRGRTYDARIPEWVHLSAVAHRGLHDLDAGIPENSRAGIEAAGRARCSVEFDVAAMVGAEADDVVAMLVHDDRLTRLTMGASHAVTRTTPADDIRGLRILGTDETFIDIEQALDAFLATRPHGGFGILIDVKSESLRDRGLEEAIASTLRARRDEFEPGTVMITTFNPFTLRWFRINEPWVGRSLGAVSVAHAPPKRRVLAWLAVLTREWLVIPLTRPDMISHEFQGLPAHWVQQWRRRTGGEVFAWTIRDPDALMSGTVPIFEGFPPEVARERGLSSWTGQAGWPRPPRS